MAWCCTRGDDWLTLKLETRVQAKSAQCSGKSDDCSPLPP